MVAASPLFVRGSNPDAIMFPLVLDDTRKYFSYLASIKAARSTYTGWIECIGFLVHVLGVDADPNLHLDPLVRGTLRGLASSRPRRKQSRPFRVHELVTLENFLMNENHSLVDRYICGCILFAVFSGARFGDLRDIEKFVEDIPSDQPEHGFLEIHSASHKTRATGDGLGMALPLVAPVRGFSSGLWGIHFSRVAQEAGLAFCERPRGSLLLAPDPLGSWTSRSLTNAEVGRWFRSVLEESGEARDLSELTPHGAKATLLSYLARFGASPTDRLILGHHSVKKFGALETYSRDLLSGPLRTLQHMITSVKEGTFHPDTTRSGLFRDSCEDQVEQAQHQTHGEGLLSVYAMSPSSRRDEDGHGAVQAEESVENVMDEGFSLVQPLAETAASRLGIGNLQDDDSRDEERLQSDSDSGSSDSSSSSSCGSDDEVFGAIRCDRVEQVVWKEGCIVFQHVKSKALHLCPKDDTVKTFLCGRKVSQAYKIFSSPVFCNEWKRKQCNVGKPIRSIETAVAALDSALKRHKK